MWKNDLESIRQEMETYQELVNNGALEVELSKFQTEVKKRLSITLPDDYLNYLRCNNGIEFNGFVLYSIDEYILNEPLNQQVNEFIATNEIWYEVEEQKQYIFIGDSNISWYVYSKLENIYYELDKPSGNRVKKYINIDELLDDFFSDAIN